MRSTDFGPIVSPLMMGRSRGGPAPRHGGTLIVMMPALNQAAHERRHGYATGGNVFDPKMTYSGIAANPVAALSAAAQPGLSIGPEIGSAIGSLGSDALGMVGLTPGALGLASQQGPPLGGGSTTEGVDLGSTGRMGLSAMGMIPGPLGMAATLGGLGLRGWNVNNAENALGESDLPGLSLGQMIGGVLGLNDYGQGSNASVAHAISQAGGNVQSAGSPGFSPSAASGEDSVSHSGMAGTSEGMSPGNSATAAAAAASAAGGNAPFWRGGRARVRRAA